MAESIDVRVRRWFDKPWLLYHRPFKVADGVYFVGTEWVSVFLLDTTEGLVLIDTALKETVYQLVDSIYRLGFDPHNIKKIFLTHGHFDHTAGVGQIQQMSGCEVYIGEGDAYFYSDRRDLIVFEDHCPEFTITGTYDYGKKIDLGNFRLEPVHCPGHTEGTTSFFFEATIGGEKVNCAIHGGLGAGALSKRSLEMCGLPLSLRDQYFDSIAKVLDRKVDVILPSHAGHSKNFDFFAAAEQDDGSGRAFINPNAWRDMLSDKAEEIRRMIEQGL